MIHLDFEVRSVPSIAQAGAFAWLEHPASRLLCLAYSIDGAEPVLWHPTFPLVPEDLQDPGASFVLGSGDLAPLFERIQAGELLWAHNAQFERAVFELVAGPRLGWPVPRPEQWRCTQALCAAHSLPLKLEAATRVLGLEERKDTDGGRVMKKLAQPRKRTKGDWSRWHEGPEDLQTLFAYCLQDVRAEMALHRVLRDLSPEEWKVYQADQAVNFRGVQVDVELCRTATWAGEERKHKLVKECQGITDGLSFTQVEACRDWMKERGVELPDLTAETVRDELARDAEVRVILEEGREPPGAPLPPEVRRLLEIRAAGSKASVAKYGRMLKMVSQDGRFRGGYQFHGATTGRWVGRGVQLQNLPRGAGEAEQSTVIQAVKESGLPLLELLYLDPIARLSRVIRGALVAAPGRKLVVADFASIEARGVLWLAGQEDVLQLFRDGVDLYCWMAGHIFEEDGEDIRRRAKVEEEPRGVFQRFLGKESVLGGGYGMGAPRFRSQCAQKGVEITEDQAELGIGMYRERCHLVPDLWKATERAALLAVREPGRQVESPRVSWKKVGRFLHARLPSGRLLSYYRPEIRHVRKKLPDKRLPDGTVQPGRVIEGPKLFYQAMRTGQWGRVGLFGGLLVENLTQAICRDLLAERLVALEEAGIGAVVHSHDEVVVEVPEDSPVGPKFLEDFLAMKPSWAEGFPVKAEGWEGKRYRK